MTLPITTPLMNVMVAAARKAARALMRDFGEVENLQVSRKGPADFVTKADLRAEKILREELQRARPHYGLVLEEAGVIEGPDKTHRWIVDPLDGTTNFLHAIPHWAISIGLEREGQLVAGCIYAPVQNDFYLAERGQGAWINDRRLRVSARKDLKDAVIATGIPFRGREGHETFQKELTVMMRETAGVRRFGAASLDLVWVAQGRFDAFWERGLSPWDVAAGIVILREAGGMVTDLSGEANMLATGDILATNSNLHGPMLSALTKL